MESTRDEAGVLDQWTARKIQPRIVVYVGVVFAAFMALAHFLFHSPAAVKALAAAGTAAIFQLLLGVVNKVEYRLTESELKKRPLKEKEPAQFESVFRWEELSHVVPIKNGFKYFKQVDQSSKVRQFWNTYLSEAASGEVHLEAEDRERILGVMAGRNIPMSKPAHRPSISPGNAQTDHPEG